MQTKTDLDLSLPETAEQPNRIPGSGRILLVLILLALVIDIIISAGLMGTGMRNPGTAKTGLDSRGRRELALKLENQGLNLPAAQIWEEYLENSDAEAEERAKICYRIGKLYQGGQKFDLALSWYYRSESLAEIEDLNAEIGRKTRECLESLGKFAALRYELADRVGMDKQTRQAGDEVLAEIGRRKITAAELDSILEKEVDRQLAQFAAYLPPEQARQQKEQLLKRFSDNRERLRALQQFITEELCYRRARETGLADDPVIQSILKDTARKILARKLMEKELASKINITPVDLETYYEANKDSYVQPERVRAAHILLKDESEARDVCASIQKGKSFEHLSASLSLDERTSSSDGEIEGWIEKETTSVPGIGPAPEFVERLFETEPGTVATNPVKTPEGWHVVKVLEKEPARQKSFEQVQQEVFMALQRTKEQEVQQAMIEKLKDEYDVAIHFSKLALPDEQPADARPSGNLNRPGKQ